MTDLHRTPLLEHAPTEIANPRHESLRILTYGWLGMGAVALLDMAISKESDPVETAIVAITSITGVMVYVLSLLKWHRIAAYLFCLSVDLTFFYLYVVNHGTSTPNPIAVAETSGVTLAASGLGIVFAGALINRWAPLAFAAMNIALLVVIRKLIPDVGITISAPVIWSLLALSIWMFGTLIERMFAGLAAARAGMQEQVQRLSENAALLDLASDAIFIEDTRGTIRYWNRGAELMYGIASEAIVGKRFDDFVASEYPRPLREIEQHLSRHGRWEGELMQRLPDGREIWANTRRALQQGRAAGQASTLVINSDITQKKSQDERLAFLSDHSRITGLPGHALLLDRLRQALLRARRSGRLMAFIMLDIDRFKSINSGLGLQVGDTALHIVGERLIAAVGPDNSVGHLAGDTFGLVIESCETPDELERLARRIQQELAEPLDALGHQLSMTASLGISRLSADTQDAEQMMRGANSAMHTAKEQGRNRFRFYDPSQDQRHLRRTNMEGALRSAIERNELYLAYQPKVETGSGRIVGVEALLRWRSAEFGEVRPADFIPLAEESGLIDAIGHWVLEAACRQAQQWHQQGHTELTLAVNISARQLQEARIIESIESVLATTGFAAARLELEITESAIMQNVEYTIAMLERLRRMGILLSIDDFGTGYSSLNYLKRFPVQTLKIDQSFVRDLSSNTGDAALVATIVSLAKNFGMRVIAEGVETQAQRTFLRDLHCDECQGYLFSRPVPPEEIALLLGGDALAAVA